LYLYGIVDRAIHPALIAGAIRDGRTLDTTGAGRVAAVHADIDPDELAGLEPDLTDGSALAALACHHDEVVTALALTGAVLPVRMGTLLPDRDALVALIEDDQAGLADALDRVRGRAEWRARVVATGDAEDTRGSSVPREDSGTAYLLGRRAERQKAGERRAALAAVDEALAFHADAAAGPLLASAARATARAFLVGETMQDDFVAAAEDAIPLLARFGCALELRGPLPAYSFADLELGRAAHV
jgi:hypothetical protein